MDKKQALELKKRLLALDKAINLVSRAVGPLDEHERDALGAEIGKLFDIANRRLLPYVYGQHPELKPSERGVICSTLRWSKVSLPPSVPVDEIDQIIFAVVKPQWQKMAKVITGVLKTFREKALPIDNDEVVAARIVALAEDGHFDGVGDLRMWGHSEIRHKQTHLN